FGDEYLQWDFAQDFWYTRDFMPQVISCALSESPFNETHWDDPDFNKVFDKARAIPDAGERREWSTNCRRCSTTKAATSSGASPTRSTPSRSTSAGSSPTPRAGP